MELWKIGLVVAAVVIYLLVTTFLAGNLAAEVRLAPGDSEVGSVPARFERVRSVQKVWLLAAVWPFQLVLGFLSLLLAGLTWPFRAAYRMGKGGTEKENAPRSASHDW